MHVGRSAEGPEALTIVSHSVYWTDVFGLGMAGGGGGGATNGAARW